MKMTTVVVAATLLAGTSYAASADNVVFVQQFGNGNTVNSLQVANPTNSFRTALHAARAESFQSSSPTPGFLPSPKTAFSGTGSRNFAQSVVVGNDNQVGQVQAGVSDRSTVGVFGGNKTNVGVWQIGNGLTSNVELLGTQGLHIDVFQPNGSMPIKMLIARLPDGSLLIKR